MISVVIPTLNEEAVIASSLRHLLAQDGEFEVIVVDGGSRDATMRVAERFPGVRVLLSPRAKGAQMNLGAANAQGDILLFLHADTRLPADALAMIKQALDDPDVAAGSFCLRFDHPGRLLGFFARGSRFNHTLFTYGDQGLFVRAPAFRATGGFADIPLMEDVEIQRRLRRQGRFVKIRTPVLTSARRYLQKGIVRQQALNTALVLLFHLGVSPQTLARTYSFPHGPGQAARNEAQPSLGPGPPTPKRGAVKR